MTNYFRELHPISTGIYFFILLLLIMVSSYDWDMAVFFAALSPVIIYTGGIRPYMKSLKTYGMMIAIFGIFNVIFNHQGDTPFLYVNGIPLTVEALTYGIFTGFMAASLLMWFQIFNSVFDSRKITWLTGRYFPVTGLILSMVFCYYDKFRNKIDKIKEVWHSYGTEEKFGKVKHAGIILSVLLSVMLEDSMDTAMSMKARGYGGTKRTSYLVYHREIRDGILILAALCFFTVSFLTAEWVRRAVLAGYAAIPAVYNIYKEMQWKYYRSKI